MADKTWSDNQKKAHSYLNNIKSKEMKINNKELEKEEKKRNASSQLASVLFDKK